MKFLALMKDSVREAIDAKVFYVTIALSFVLVLVVGSVSFRSLTAEEEIAQRGQLLWVLKILVQAKTQLPPDDFVLHIENFEETNKDEHLEPWNGVYQFD